MTVTRDEATVELVATLAGGSDITSMHDMAYAYYVVKPGDVITITAAGEAKGGVKAGPDVKSDVVDADGVLTHPINSTFGGLPASYTVGEHDLYINIYNQRS